LAIRGKQAKKKRECFKGVKYAVLGEELIREGPNLGHLVKHEGNAVSKMHYGSRRNGS